MFLQGAEADLPESVRVMGTPPEDWESSDKVSLDNVLSEEGEVTDSCQLKGCFLDLFKAGEGY